MHLVDELAENSLGGILIQVNGFQRDYFAHHFFRKAGLKFYMTILMC